jgi:hypothetical protein
MKDEWGLEIRKFVYPHIRYSPRRAAIRLFAVRLFNQPFQIG